MQLKLKSKSLSVHSNLGAGTHGRLGILMTSTKYATLSLVAYIRPMYTGALQIPSNTTCAASYKVERVYENNLQVFHKVHGVEQALIQQVVTSVNKQFIISINNRTTG